MLVERHCGHVGMDTQLQFQSVDFALLKGLKTGHFRHIEALTKQFLPESEMNISQARLPKERFGGMRGPGALGKTRLRPYR